MSGCEDSPQGIPRIASGSARLDSRWRRQLQSGKPLKDPSRVGVEDESIESLWHNAVRIYSRCALSNMSDKLMAIWSVAKLVRDALQEDYGAGFWTNRLEEQLAWKVVDCTKTDGSASKRIISEQLSSWSLASVDGMIEPQYRFRGRDEMERVYRVKNHEGSDIQFETEGQKTKNKDGIEAYADTPPKLAGGEIGVIAIKGYLKEGYLLRDEQTYR